MAGSGRRRARRSSPARRRSTPPSPGSTTLAEEFADHLELVDQLRSRFEHEAEHALPGPDDEPNAADQEQLDHQAIRQAVVSAQREAVIALRDDGVIGDEALRRVERDLDLEAVRSGV